MSDKPQAPTALRRIEELKAELHMMQEQLDGLERTNFALRETHKILEANNATLRKRVNYFEGALGRIEIFAASAYAEEELPETP